jgi:hypothetical protein
MPIINLTAGDLIDVESTVLGGATWSGGDAYLGNGAWAMADADPPFANQGSAQITGHINIDDLPSNATSFGVEFTISASGMDDWFYSNQTRVNVNGHSIGSLHSFDVTDETFHASDLDTSSREALAASTITLTGSTSYSEGAGDGTAGSWTISAFSIQITYELPTFSIRPTSGGITDHRAIVITGSGFVDGITVQFGTDNATDVVVVDEFTIRCKTPFHAEGLVDVTLTYPDDSTNVLVDGYTYIISISAPSVEAGPTQVAIGPPPTSITTAAEVTPGFNNGTLSYAWTQIDGPVPATILSPTTINTEITFDSFVIGVYRFQLMVTTGGDVVLTATGIMNVRMNPTRAPVVSSGRAQIFLS